MSTTAELTREWSVFCTSGDNAYDITVLLAKECNSTSSLCIFDAHDLSDNRLSSKNLCIYHAFNTIKLIFGKSLKVRKVKAHAIWGNKRTSLVNVISQNLLECCVKQVRCRVVTANELTAASINGCGDRITNREGTLLYHANVGLKATVAMLGVSDVNVETRSCQLAGVPYLAAHLCIERRAVKYNLNLRASRSGLNLLSILNKSNNTNARELIVVVAVKDGLIKAVRECNPDALSITPGIAVSRCTSALTLLCHCSVKGVHVNNVTCICSNLTSKINRESVGIVQKECNLTGKLCAILKLLKLSGELGLACVKRSAKALLFCGQNAVDKSTLLDKLWVFCAKQNGNLMCVLCHEGSLDAQQAAVVDSATEQTAKNVASTLVTRENTVTNHKGNCTGVVCKNAQAAVNLVS